MVNAMVEDDLLVLTDNPRHKRAKLVALSDAGASLYQKVFEEEIEFMNQLSEGMSLDSIKQCREVLAQVREQLEVL